MCLYVCMYSLNSSGPGLEKVVHTRRTSCLRGWPREFGALNTSPRSWIFTSVSVASSLRSYLFTSATVRIGVPIAPKYGTVSMEPTRYVTLHFRDQRGAASLRHRHRAEITSLCVNRSPIRYDFCTSEKAIQCSANIACNHMHPSSTHFTTAYSWTSLRQSLSLGQRRPAWQA